MKESLKMIAALVLFATAICVGLSVVYEVTYPAIEANKSKSTREAQKQLFPSADFEDITGQIRSGNSQVTFNGEYAALENGRVTGVIINSQTEGFSAPLVALVGISGEGTIIGVHIISNTDTPGLGSHAHNPKYFVDKPQKTKTFYGQFNGMSVDSAVSVQKDGGEVVAITAATISSRAVALLVSEALRQGSKWLQTQGGAQ